MAEIVILGAGLTGLSAAYHLEKQGFFDYKIFEKENEPGGLCRSITQDGFTFDYTGHLLHINDEYFTEFSNDIFGLDQFNHLSRKSWIYSQETYTPYPYQINLYGLPTQTIVECIKGFIQKNPQNTETKTFVDWVMNNFGAGFAKHFFFPYQSKIFDFDVEKLSASWTGRFVPSTSLEDIITGSIKKPIDQEIGYNCKFHYPKAGGINFLIKKISSKLRNPIQTNFESKTIDLKNKKITFKNGHVESFNKTISTIPLDIFLKQTQNKELVKAANKLLCNTVLNFNIGVNHPNLSEKHWIYYPEIKYPFYRAGFPHNFSDSMAPKNCSSMYGEISFLNKNTDFQKEQLTTALDSIKKTLKINNHEITTENILTLKHAYVIYDEWRDNNLEKILSTLETQNIISTGRYGAWKYSSMQEAILDGRESTSKLIFQLSNNLQKKRHNEQIL
ncbi:MAG: hypothetical protein UR26_C0003G0113 [candidate division TM6 bacterium GW2011_GWF2_32_72]|nr:MAG: hypothetical protein UR26_C0003G0113 [candidate division TM6 bacterium GW2011_GWF2_32_72]